MSAAASAKTASADSPIHEVLAERWSPYAFRDKPVSQDELRSLFEAARWAPSSYNEQPWRYVVATRDDRAQFERLLSCLVEGNQAWAKHVPVLALGIVSLKFAKNGKDNRAAVHDLGLAAGNLVVEATARGLRWRSGLLPKRLGRRVLSGRRGTAAVSSPTLRAARAVASSSPRTARP